MDLYRERLNEKWGAGWAAFLYHLSQKIEPWEISELEQLRSAAKHSVAAYTKLYFDLSPSRNVKAKPLDASGAGGYGRNDCRFCLCRQLPREVIVQ
jgi:hypothetical protein